MTIGPSPFPPVLRFAKGALAFCSTALAMFPEPRRAGGAETPPLSPSSEGPKPAGWAPAAGGRLAPPVTEVVGLRTPVAPVVDFLAGLAIGSAWSRSRAPPGCGVEPRQRDFKVGYFEA